jgi:hypothetical protein
MTRPAIYFYFCTYYFLFYLRSLIIAAFVNVSDVICDVGDNENDQTEQAAIAKATKKTSGLSVGKSLSQFLRMELLSMQDANIVTN